MTDPIIIVQIPHQMPAKAFAVYGWTKALIALDGNFSHSATYAELQRDFERGELPEKAWKIAETKGSVVFYTDPNNNTEYFNLGDEPSIEDIVSECASYDKNCGFVLDGKSAALNFINTYSGHQGVKAVTAVRKEAEWLDWIKPEEEDD